MSNFDENKIVDQELETLGNYIAKALIKLAKNIPISELEVDNPDDYAIGELARCLTLQGLYLDREEYEKCAFMKLRIFTLNKKLGIDPEDILEDPDEEQ